MTEEQQAEDAAHILAGDRFCDSCHRWERTIDAIAGGRKHWWNRDTEQFVYLCKVCQERAHPGVTTSAYGCPCSTCMSQFYHQKAAMKGRVRSIGQDSRPVSDE